MTGKKRLLKTYGIICTVITIIIFYLALKTAPYTQNNTDIFQIITKLSFDLQNTPMKIMWCNNSKIALLYAIGISFVIDVLIMTSAKNYRYGEEHGSAQWGSASKITKEYSDKEKMNNLLLTQNVRLSFNDRKTNLNCNCIVVGGPGTGKTFHYVLPNVIKCTGESMVVCDPKGSTLKNAGKILKKNGYRVKVLDLKTPELSWGYNPFEYIRNEDDIYKMVELIFTANTPKDTRAQDPFFDDNAKFLFLACCYYLYYKAPKEEQNLPFVLEMINFLELRDDDFNYISPFDELFLELQQEEPHNIAVDYYLKFRQAKGRTAMSVVSSLVAKIGKYSLNSVKQISVHDELELNKLADEPTALFLLLPDDDKSMNFICSVLYMQLFQQLYDRAEDFPDDRLPRHVQIYMDEWANITLADDFDQIIATCRSRDIGISVILQGFSQIKKIYKEAWENIPAQCSTFLYMGGMEQSTHEYVSKMLDKETINTNSFGLSRGRQGSYTKNDQLSGRELLTPGEVRLLQKKHAIVIIQGEKPVLDPMIETQKMKAFILSKALGKFDHSKLEHSVTKTTVTPLYYDDGTYNDLNELNDINIESDMEIISFSKS